MIFFVFSLWIIIITTACSVADVGIMLVKEKALGFFFLSTWMITSINIIIYGWRKCGLTDAVKTVISFNDPLLTQYLQCNSEVTRWFFMQDITYRFSMDLIQILRLYTFSTITYSGDYRDSRALIGRGLRHNVCRYNHPRGVIIAISASSLRGKK